MNRNTFDRIVVRLGTDASRRRVLGGLFGAATAALAGSVGLEAKPKHAAKNRRRHTGGGGTDKVAICHFTNGGERARRLRVSGRALRGHLAHGDTRFVDCCVNEDCEVPTCYTAQCVAGTCSQTTLPPGFPCTLAGGAIGNCTFGGECLPTGSGGG